jgi:hypothetical protein
MSSIFLFLEKFYIAYRYKELLRKDMNHQQRVGNIIVQNLRTKVFSFYSALSIAEQGCPWGMPVIKRR